MASTYLQRTPASAGNRKTCTFSAWVKRGNIGNNSIISCYSALNDNDILTLTLRNNGQLRVSAYNVNWRILNRLFRDTNAWYHIVLTIDTTQSTANDRIKVYVNGVQETSFSTINNPSQNADIGLNQASTTRIGSESFVAQNYFDGSMSHVHFIDGTAYDASTFGETDATTGEWKIKTSPSVTYGTNGFFILKNGNSVTDQSGNGNNWTVAGGTLTNTEDCPSNVFATLTPLAKSNGTLTNGNTTWAPSGNNASVWSSIAVNTGKWYFEMKKTSGDAFLAFSQTPKFNGFDPNEDPVSLGAFMYYPSGGASGNRFRYNGSVTAFPSGFGDDDVGTIYGVTMDFTNDEIIIRRNNDDSTKATFSIPAALKAEPIHVGYSVTTTWPSGSFDFNFGNGYFGTTAVSTPGTNASGNGIFEYDVPTGYTALSTKGLNL